MNLNENLKSKQNKCFYILNDIQRNKDDQLRLEDQIDEIKYMYQKTDNAFDRILDWQGVYKDPLETHPIYSKKKTLKGQLFFNTWKPLL